MIQRVLASFLVVGFSLAAGAQTNTSDKESQARSSQAPQNQSLPNSTQFVFQPISLKSLPKSIFTDEKSLFFKPFHMSERQWQWTVPLAFAGAALLASDTAVEKHLPTNPATVSRATNLSNAGAAAFVGAGAGMFLWGKFAPNFASNDDLRETGLLSGEAAIDALVEAEVFKYGFGRDRPFEGDGKGRFFHGGDSFPSEHATISWAIASVIAHEYPGPATQILAYGLAGGVSAARLIGQKHFATDLIAGSALGWFTGREVFRTHSRYGSAEIARWGTFTKSSEDVKERDPANMGSSYIPIDSWVYPVFDRLAALGYLSDRSTSIRPWSRIECARLLSQVHRRLENASDDSDNQVISLLRDLDAEFAPETQLREGETPNLNAELESVYSRYTGISGRPLRDSFHFAQTIHDDFGRPYGEGSNNVTGFSTNAAAGPFVIYVRGEYQYGSSIANYTPAQVIDIASSDELPNNSVPAFGVSSRLRTIEAYAGLNIANWQLTFGQQTLWWGTNRSTSILLSNNAEAMPMLRLERTAPLEIPLLHHVLGPLYFSAFLARMGGTRYLRLGPDFTLYGDGIHQVDPQPFLWGANIAFKPTPNLELGFSITTIFAGHGRPLTLETFFHSFSQHGNLQPVDPGGRRPTMSASYRLPRLRDWATVYADWMAEAQPIALFYPTQSGISAGLYLSRLPRLKKLDLRCEGIYTNVPGDSTNNLFYVNFHYPDGYRNYGQIIGSWIGRGGNGGQASTTYWFSARKQATVTYRKMTTDASLLKGGNVNDVSINGNWMFRPHLELSAVVQYERWNFAELSATPHSNVSATLQLQYWPKLRASAHDRVINP